MDEATRNATAMLILGVYQLDEEAYEEYVEDAPDCWMLPYMYIEEFIPAFALISNELMVSDAMIDFWNDYFEYQDNQPEDCRIPKHVWAVTRRILIEETNRKEFWGNMNLYVTQNSIVKSFDLRDEAAYSVLTKRLLEQARKFVIEKRKKYVLKDELQYIFESNYQEIHI